MFQMPGSYAGACHILRETLGNGSIFRGRDNVETLLERVQDATDLCHDLLPGVVRVWSGSERLVVSGQDLQGAKVRLLPGARTQQQRKDHRISRLLPAQCVLYLLLARLRGEEIGTQEKQEEAGGGELPVTFALPFLTSKNPSLIPGMDTTGAFERRKVAIKCQTPLPIGWIRAIAGMDGREK